MKSAFIPSMRLSEGLSQQLAGLTPDGPEYRVDESIHLVRGSRLTTALAAVAESVTVEYLRHQAGHGKFHLRRVHTDEGTRWQVRDGAGGLVAGSLDVDSAVRVCGALNLA